jgi:hypothetical protein
MNEAEEWRVIDGYEGRYEISSYGRVVSLARRDAIGRAIPRKLLRPLWNGEYFHVSLFKDGHVKHFDIHVLVARAFIGAAPPGQTVDHSDKNRTNNVFWNLQYLPRFLNSLQGRAKLRESEVIEARRLWLEGVPKAQIAALLGVHRTTINDLILRRTWKHLPLPKP